MEDIPNEDDQPEDVEETAAEETTPRVISSGSLPIDTRDESEPESESIEEIETTDEEAVESDPQPETTTQGTRDLWRESLPRWRGQIRRFLKLSEAQVALGWGIILVVGTLIGTIYLAQASRMAEIGRRVQILQNDLADLKRENGQMERLIAEAQTLDYLQTRAEQMGFVLADPEDIDYVVVPDYPAEVVEVEVFTPEPTPTAVPIDTFREALQLEIDQVVRGLTSGTSE